MLREKTLQHLKQISLVFFAFIDGNFEEFGNKNRRLNVGGVRGINKITTSDIRTVFPEVRNNDKY